MNKWRKSLPANEVHTTYLVTLPGGDRTYIWRSLSEEQAAAFKEQGGRIIRVCVMMKPPRFHDAELEVEEGGNIAIHDPETNEYLGTYYADSRGFQKA